MEHYLFPASALDAVLVCNADDNKTRPMQPQITTYGRETDEAVYREQFVIMNGCLYRKLVAS